MLSVIVPAYNEEKLLPQTLNAIHAALADIGESELIVVDNESTDRTHEIAEARGALIVSETVHNISAVRNAGSKAAAGGGIFFVGADTLVRARVFLKIVKAVFDPPCFCGSGAVEYERPYTRVLGDPVLR